MYICLLKMYHFVSKQKSNPLIGMYNSNTKRSHVPSIYPDDSVPEPWLILRSQAKKERILVIQLLRKGSVHVAQKIENEGKETVLTFDIKDGFCINNFNGIIFLFTDGTRLQELNHGSDNCVSFAMLKIGIPDYEGNTIKSYLEQKKIKTLRIYTNDSFIQVDFSESNQDKLIKTLQCID